VPLISDKMKHIFHVFGMLLIILILSGCQEEPVFNPENYRMPDTDDMIVYEVDNIDGYRMDQVVIQDEYNKSKEIDEWYEKQKLAEDFDKYNVLSKAWRRKDSEKEDHLAEEKRIFEYCKEFGLEKCRKIDRACDEEGCRNVTIVCDDDDYDPGIDDYEECSTVEVTVSEDYDDTLTKDEDLEVCY